MWEKVRGMGHGDFVPPLGLPLSQHLHVFTNLEAPMLLGFLWRLPPLSIINYQLPVQALCPLENLGGAENSKLVVWLCLSGDLGAHPVTLLEQKMLLLPRKFQGI